MRSLIHPGNSHTMIDNRSQPARQLSHVAKSLSMAFRPNQIIKMIINNKIARPRRGDYLGGGGQREKSTDETRRECGSS